MTLIISCRASAQVAVCRRRQRQSHRAAHAAKQPERSLSDPRIREQLRLVPSDGKPIICKWLIKKIKLNTPDSCVGGRLLLAVHPEEVRLSGHGLCQALPRLLPAERLGVHLSRANLPLPAPPCGTLLRSVGGGLQPRSSAQPWKAGGERWSFSLSPQSLQTVCVVVWRLHVSSSAQESPSWCPQV